VDHMSLASVMGPAGRHEKGDHLAVGLMMPGVDGVEATWLMTRVSPGTAVLVVRSMSDVPLAMSKT
jgi:DNA-binding NarL/FixJ family response regulator